MLARGAHSEPRANAADRARRELGAARAAPKSARGLARTRASSAAPYLLGSAALQLCARPREAGGGRQGERLPPARPGHRGEPRRGGRQGAAAAAGGAEGRAP